MVRTLLFHGINTGSNPVKGILKIVTKVPRYPLRGVRGHAQLTQLRRLYAASVGPRKVR